MEFNNNVCKIRVDVEKTREYYKSYLNDFCDCLYCKNYLKALPLYSQELIRLLERMGIDYTKEGESMDFGENSDGTYSYLYLFLH